MSTPIEVCEPQAGVGHSKNSTWFRSASALEAVIVNGIGGGGVDDPDRSGDVDRGCIVVDAAILDHGRGGGVAGVVDRDHA